MPASDKARALRGIVGQKANPADAEVTQDRGRQAEISAVGLEPEGMIRFDGVDADILQLVRLQLRHQADAATLLIFVDHQSAAFFGDRLHGHGKLIATIATQRAQRFAGEALRMDAQQRRRLASDRP